VEAYPFQAPEVECIGKGKAAAPYEAGIKASIVTNNRPAPGGQFVLHAKAVNRPFNCGLLSSCHSFSPVARR
jgi:hypothetical protein